MGSSTTKQTTENKPPEWAKPLFEQSAGVAQSLYNSGSGGNVYQGQRVADLSGTTQGGITGVSNAAASWDMPGYGNMLAQAQQPTSAQSNLGDMASGKNLLANPFFEDALRGQLDKTAAQVQSQFSGSGRYGSGANNSVLAGELGNIRSNALYNQYNQDVQNMLTANGMIDNSKAQNIASQLGIGNQAFQNQLAGANAQIGAGQVIDQNQQDKLSAAHQKWNEQDMREWTRLGLLQSAASGSAGNYGTAVTTAKSPMNPLGIAGAVGSAVTKSDARLKENIVPVGRENGHVLWEFNYRGSPGRHRGVMAQMVMDDRPDAVFMEPDGFYAVDYGALGLEMEAV
jgi:hypothetical protein